MKTVILFITPLSLCFILIAGCAQKQSLGWESIKNPEVLAQLKLFVAEKEAQANAATNASSPEMKAFFAAADKGDWLTMSNIFQDFRNHADQFEHSGKTDERLRGTKWQAIMEIWGTFAAFCEGDEKYSAAFANDIIASISPGSIYFGGTDPGRFLIVGMQKNQVAGDPFFTITQNAMADGTYLDYLHSMYDGKIYIATAEDSQRCFEEYIDDAKKRLKTNQLKPGEAVHIGENGQTQASGQVAVMEINGLLIKTIFEKNPGHEFYIEESFPLDWMYPYLEPHGLIMKINQQPLTGLSDEILRQDRDYWVKYVLPMIGGWLNTNTSVKEIAAFVEKVHVKKDLNRFTGDPRFIQNEYSCRMFSKLRSSIGGLYAWRGQHATDADEKRRMNDSADFAFRQAWALCPYSPEAVFRYVNLLLSEGRTADAILIAETAAKMTQSEGEQIRKLITQLKQYQTQKPN